MSSFGVSGRGLPALKALNEHLRAVSPTGIAQGSAGQKSFPALRSVQWYGPVWARWAAQARMTRTLQQGPDNAGPLNSHRLAVRALAQVEALSPAYSASLMAQLDGLNLLLKLQSKAVEPSSKATSPNGSRKKAPLAKTRQKLGSSSP